MEKKRKKKEKKSPYTIHVYLFSTVDSGEKKFLVCYIHEIRLSSELKTASIAISPTDVIG